MTGYCIVGSVIIAIDSSAEDVLLNYRCAAQLCSKASGVAQNSLHVVHIRGCLYVKFLSVLLVVWLMFLLFLILCEELSPKLRIRKLNLIVGAIC